MGNKVAIANSKLDPVAQLTEIQRLYVEARCSGLGLSASARAAGVTKHVSGRADEFEKNPRVRNAIDWVITQGAPELTKEVVLDGLMDAVRSAATSAELTMAYREMGKIIGAYAPDRLEITHKDLTTEKLKNMTDGDLIKYMGRERMKDEVEDVYDAEYEVLSDGVSDPEPVTSGRET
jgi:hypothetical protein